MKAYNLLFLSLLFLACFSSCEQEMLPGELVRYVTAPENGLRQIKNVGAFELDLQYKPMAYVIANEFRSNELEESKYAKRQKELEGLEYYNLKIKVNKEGENITTFQVHNQDQQQNRLYYLSYELKNDLRMVQGRDTVAPALYHFERTYDVSSHRTFVLAFPKSEEKGDRTLIVNSQEIGTGPIKIKIKEHAINNTPSIKLL